MIASFSNLEIDETLFNFISKGISEWRKENRIQQRRDAAKKRWTKKSRK
jgi:hypothetical protein